MLCGPTCYIKSGFSYSSIDLVITPDINVWGMKECHPDTEGGRISLLSLLLPPPPT